MYLKAMVYTLRLDVSSKLVDPFKTFTKIRWVPWQKTSLPLTI